VETSARLRSDGGVLFSPGNDYQSDVINDVAEVKGDYLTSAINNDTQQQPDAWSGHDKRR
jgi:hypothetical protein